MFEKLGTVTYARRRWVVAAALAFLAFAGVWGTGVFGSLTSGGFEDPDSESARSAAVVAADLGRDEADVVVLYRSPDRTVEDPAFRRAVTATLAALPAADVARSVDWFSTRAPGLVSADRHATYAVLTLTGDEQQRTDALDRIEGRLAAPGLRTSVGGATTVGRDINERVSADIARAETLSMPILLVLLVIVFGSVVAAGLPLAIGAIAILGAFTGLRVLSLVTEVSVFSVNVVTILGMGLAIDYGLFVVSRYREELARGLDPRAALVRTMATAGRTVAVSGLTVAVSLSGLLIFPQVFLRSMGAGGIAAVLVAVVAALTVLPALLAVLGTRVDALPVRRRFSLSGISFIKLIGVAMAIAIVVDATVVRALLLPATMRLLGRWNWWAPAPLRRFQERFGLHEAPEPGPFGTLDRPAQAPGNRRDVAGVVQ